ncbi:diaminobutyrate--2-oxoglutarate transaminase [Maritalea sp. S77]|uniref:diaminobutyrate--2-oxoglutarate transaminase n=1 Tax=Maritalea sp. S77 TaxID=3415125 RepID=UPI003C7BABF3
MTNSEQNDLLVFERRESAVRSYCRAFPKMFDRAVNAKIFGADEKEYIDFLAGCASLNYGHNDPDMKQALIDFISRDGIAHGLDMHTNAKRDFLQAFHRHILAPRNMDYRTMFTGPTGANAVEAALKLARKVTGRTNVISFTNGFHGMTLGALATTGNAGKRGGAGMDLSGVHRAPFDGYFGDNVDTAEQLDILLSDSSAGIDAPAAILVEAVQGEGGLNVASKEWMQKMQAIAKKHGALFIVDDIQAGCGRTGTFFSFEEMDIEPDIITMAKSLSGMGLPFAVTLFKPELDIWKPGEHNGTFRGNNHAFITAKVAIEKFWADDSFQAEIQEKSEYLEQRLQSIADKYGFGLKGRGMMMGIDCGNGDDAADICEHAFENGVIVETSGSDDEIVKILAPLTIEKDTFAKGLDIIETAFDCTLVEKNQRSAAE